MFEELLNKELRAFIKRATDKNRRWQSNVISIDTCHNYYVEYYQERLYWVYDYYLEITTMVFASSPAEAVEIAKQKVEIAKQKHVILNGNSRYIEKVDTLILKENE